MDWRAQVAHVDREDSVKVVEHLDPADFDCQAAALRLADLVPNLGVQATPQPVWVRWKRQDQGDLLQRSFKRLIYGGNAPELDLIRPLALGLGDKVVHQGIRHPSGSSTRAAGIQERHRGNHGSKQRSANQEGWQYPYVGAGILCP
jgi:hypothetical protein